MPLPSSPFGTPQRDGRLRPSAKSHRLSATDGGRCALATRCRQPSNEASSPRTALFVVPGSQVAWKSLMEGLCWTATDPRCVAGGDARRQKGPRTPKKWWAHEQCLERDASKRETRSCHPSGGVGLHSHSASIRQALGHAPLGSDSSTKRFPPARVGSGTRRAQPSPDPLIFSGWRGSETPIPLLSQCHTGPWRP